jgi:hypothetical protein
MLGCLPKRPTKLAKLVKKIDEGLISGPFSITSNRLAAKEAGAVYFGPRGTSPALKCYM